MKSNLEPIRLSQHLNSIGSFERSLLIHAISIIDRDSSNHI